MEGFAGGTSDTTAGKTSGRGATAREIVLSVRDLTVGFGSNIVLDKLNLDIYRGEILGFVGASGTGKSVLMRTVLRLAAAPFRHDQDPRRRISTRSARRSAWRSTCVSACSFSTARLFSSLTVHENIQVPMREYLDLPQDLMDELARLKIEHGRSGAGGGGQISRPSSLAA